MRPTYLDNDEPHRGRDSPAAADIARVGWPRRFRRGSDEGEAFHLPLITGVIPLILRHPICDKVRGYVTWVRRYGNRDERDRGTALSPDRGAACPADHRTADGA